MKLAVFSDIHGNYVALEKCIDYVLNKGVEGFIFLGDYLGELAYPQKTMEIVYSIQDKYPCWFIKGNKEDYWLNYNPAWKDNDSTTGALYYTYHNLTDKDMKFYAQLSHEEELSLEGLPKIRLCHGSPNRVNEKMKLGDKRTLSMMDNIQEDYVLCGHTHIQGTMQHNNKVLWNAGSVGMSLQGNAKAHFLILQSTPEHTWECEMISLDYDVEKVIDDLHTSGLFEHAPSWSTVSVEVLRNGEISHGDVLGTAMELCREKTGQCNWPEVPEEYWKLAIKEMLK